VECDTVVLVTQRGSRSELYEDLRADPSALEEAGIDAVHLIGDAWQPGMVAQATFSGHRLAREIDSDDPATPLPFIRERRLLNATEQDYALGSATLARGLDVPAG
jgi:dimethylamine/trimethylamine dehydrogenase